MLDGLVDARDESSVTCPDADFVTPSDADDMDDIDEEGQLDKEGHEFERNAAPLTVPAAPQAMPTAVRTGLRQQGPDKKEITGHRFNTQVAPIAPKLTRQESRDGRRGWGGARK